MNRLIAAVFAAGLLAASVPAARAADAAAPVAAAHSQTALINEKIAEGWKAAEIKKPAAKASDHEFIRRVFIDLIGRVATPEEVIDFEQDKSADKRAKLVKRLLYDGAYKPKSSGTPFKGADGKPMVFDYTSEYAQHWSHIWTVWLMSRTVDARYREQMGLWLYKAFGEDRSYRDMVVQLLTATGKSNQHGEVNFIAHQLGDNNPPEKRTELGPFDAVPATSRITRLFLGLQTQCTQCHDHPFNKEWIQSDFWGVNAYLRQTTRDGTPTRNIPGQQMMANLAVLEISDSTTINQSGIVFYEKRDGKLMASKPNMLKDYAQAEKGESPNKTMQAANGSTSSGAKTRREVMAQYVVSHDNFSRAFVNRIWGHLFGRGLNKEPSIDDFGSHNEVVHPELLNGLAADFAKYKYSPKLLLEWICTSEPYSLSHVASKDYADQKYDPYFARMPLKALSPEVLYESLMTATRAGLTADSQQKRKERDAWMGKLVRNFGDDEGNELTFNGTVVQALLMMNGRELNDEISAKGTNAVEKAVAKHSKGGGTNVDGVLDELFLMTLNRRPFPEEKAKLKGVMLHGALVKGEAPKTEGPTPGAKTSPGGKPTGTKPAPGGKPGPKPKGPVITGQVAPTGAHDVSFYQDVFWALLNTNEFMLNH
ncbi:DUF1549 domain-containing protein [Fimbriiglobus ruber]|uniref:DUF1549 domain-containing protein n=1 Tax=Fimbriiglobus ruber TaxID=1908690 RepID=A0A225DV00_9BACT|nr:DUF1549 domain-containing protein [Fimbriiglobus ruber]OWK43474.1 hypothetical protein FRUB_03073 [Fimbriiglobus ruber]